MLCRGSSGGRLAASHLTHSSLETITFCHACAAHHHSWPLDPGWSKRSKDRQGQRQRKLRNHSVNPTVNTHAHFTHSRTHFTHARPRPRRVVCRERAPFYLYTAVLCRPTAAKRPAVDHHHWELRDFLCTICICGREVAGVGGGWVRMAVRTVRKSGTKLVLHWACGHEKPLPMAREQ